MPSQPVQLYQGKYFLDTRSVWKVMGLGVLCELLAKEGKMDCVII